MADSSSEFKARRDAAKKKAEKTIKANEAKALKALKDRQDRAAKLNSQTVPIETTESAPAGEEATE